VTAIRTLIVDDHRMFTDALELLLRGEGALDVIGVAASAEEALELTERQCPDVVLMDIDLPGMDGLEGIRHLREGCPDIRVVVITATQEGDVLASAVEAGAGGFVHKAHAADVLVEVIRHAAAGEMVLPEGHIEETLRQLQEARRGARDANRLAEELTDREVEILQAFTEGLSMREVSERMFLSPHTVKAHIGSILRKLGCRSTLQAVVLALREGLVKLSPDKT
jgi:DNA-binding NarL/FixJ family response regulator